MTKDYRVQIKIKNEWFLRKMEDVGFDSVAELSRACGVTGNTIGSFVNLKISAVDSKGQWRQPLRKISEALKCLPEDLFPPQHIKTALAKNTAELLLTAGDVCDLIGQSAQPDQGLLLEEASDSISDAILSLNPREAHVIGGRFGFDCDEKTLEDLSKELGVGRERVRQIEARALRKLSQPGHLKALASARDTLYGAH